ncbi:MAG: VanZ family protein [Candidatus Hodarchaeales archaeon]|jgi:VanZ family protein
MLIFKSPDFLKFGNLLLFFLILVISVTEFRDIPREDELLNNDKFLHVLAFFFLSLTTQIAQWNFETIKKSYNYKLNENLLNNYSIVLIITFLYGILIEVIQNFLPNRNFDLNDIIANFLGILIGLITYYISVSIKNYIYSRNI